VGAGRKRNNRTFCRALFALAGWFCATPNDQALASTWVRVFRDVVSTRDVDLLREPPLPDSQGPSDLDDPEFEGEGSSLLDDPPQFLVSMELTHGPPEQDGSKSVEPSAQVVQSSGTLPVVEDLGHTEEYEEYEEYEESDGSVITIDTGDVAPEIVMGSREVFRQFVTSGEASLASLDPRFTAGLTSDPVALVAGQGLSTGLPRGLVPLPAGQSEVTRLDPRGAYTVWNGQIVQVADMDRESRGDEMMPAAPVAPVVAVKDGSVGSLPTETQPVALAWHPPLKLGAPLLEPPMVSFGSSASMHLVGPEAQSGSLGDGGWIRGRIRVPEGHHARGVIIRLAGTSVQTSADDDGFFEIGPLSLGSSAYLLVFDANDRYNRRLVPVAVTARAREHEIPLIEASHLLTLAKSFGRQATYASAGFCGKVVGAAVGSRPESARLWLVDPKGRRYPLDYYGATGLPTQDGQLTTDGRLCAFDLPPGSYRLFVAAGSMRRSFALDLRESVFEIDRHFDMNPSRYGVLESRTLVDPELLPQLAEAPERGLSVPFFESSAVQWLDDPAGQQPPVWVRSHGFEVITEPAYAPVQVSEDSSNEPLYFATAEELIEIIEPESGSFEIVARDSLEQSLAQGAPVQYRMVPQNMANSLDERIEAQGGAQGFVWYAEWDTSLFLKSEPPYFVRLSDPWTGLPAGSQLDLGPKEQRVMRVSGGGLDSGPYTLAVYTRDGRLVWTSIVRARGSSHQVVGNRR
jgi:hypothetical protein